MVEVDFDQPQPIIFISGSPMIASALSRSLTVLVLGLLLGVVPQSVIAISDLLVTDPPTVYIQWLANSTDPMTEADGDLTTAANAFGGGAMVQLTNPVPKDVFLGLMINRIAGYDVTLTATNGGATATTGRMTVPGGTVMTYTGTLTKEASTFKGSTVAVATLDLTGGTVSATAVFSVDADLPLGTTEPNVWRLSFAFPTFSGVSHGLIINGTYTGGVTATVVMK